MTLLRQYYVILSQCFLALSVHFLWEFLVCNKVFNTICILLYKITVFNCTYIYLLHIFDEHYWKRYGQLPELEYMWVRLHNTFGLYLNELISCFGSAIKIFTFIANITGSYKLINLKIVMCVREWLCMNLYCLMHSQVPPSWIIIEMEKS